MSESDEILAQLNEIRALMDEFKSSVAPLETAKTKYEAEEKAAYQEYINKVAIVRQQKQAVDDKMFEARKKINEVQQKQRQLEYKLEQAKQEELKREKAAQLQAEYKVLEEKWNLLTAGAPWREWAKDHQISAGHKITQDRKVILADTMGLGKTLSAIIACDLAEAATREASPDHPFLGELKEVYVHGEGYVPKIVNSVERPAGKRILYFCPAPMIKNVEREFRMWAKHRNVQIVGGMTKSEREFIFKFVLKQHPEWVVICNYEAWRKDLKLIDQFIELDFDTVIIDEAHNIKDTKSIAYRGIKRLIDDLQPPYVIPMTGTPILNRPQELYALLTLVKPDDFYNLNDFLFNYCEQDKDSQMWKFQMGGLDRIARKIRTNFLRRTKEDAGIKLPPKTITMHNIEVDKYAYPNQAKVREQMRKHMMIMLDEKAGKAIAATAMIAMFTRLRQIETWPAGIVLRDPLTKEVKLQVEVEESQKIDYLISWDKAEKEWSGLIPEVVEAERCVVFSQFNAPLQEIADRVNRMGKRAVVLSGNTPASLKEEIALDFDMRHTSNPEKAKWDVLVANYKIGGAGMNLNAATQMFILDEEWNPGRRDQAYDRIHRMGQDKPVTIHVLRDEKTIDDWLANIMEHKEGLVEGFQTKMADVQDFKNFLDSMGDSGLI